MIEKLRKPTVYELIFAGNFLDDNPALISELRLEDCDFDKRLMLHGQLLLKEWPTEFTVYVRGSEPIDYFLCGAYYQVVSDRIMKIIKSSLGYTSESVEFLPIKVVANESIEDMPTYWVINVVKIIDALDWEHTNWINKIIPYDDPNAILNIIKPALKAEVVDGVDIFKFRVGKNIAAGINISASLKRKFEQSGATLGLEFKPIKVIHA